MLKKNNLTLLKNVKFSFVFVALIMQLYFVYDYKDEYQSLFIINPAILSLIALGCYFFEKKNHVVGFLFSTFFIITSWRLSDLVDIYFATKLLMGAFVFLVAEFFIMIKEDLVSGKQYEVHASFVRMFLGYDLIPHFSEKLFAGPSMRSTDILAFTHLGIENPYNTVILAGLIELIASIAFSVGFLTRITSICIFIYLMVASYLGHHFDLGFVWANPGGGWEYPVLWSCIVLSFVFIKPTAYSLDNLLIGRKETRPWLRRLISFRY